MSFEEQTSALREKLADIYEQEGDHKAAARALQGIMLESGQRYSDPLNSPLNVLHDRKGDTYIDYLYSLPPSMLQYLTVPSSFQNIHSSSLFYVKDSTNIPGQSPTNINSKSTSE